MLGSAAAASGVATASLSRFEGSLNKFTNVVKGWQYRWFVLSPEQGRIDYFLPEDTHRDRPRGGQRLAGALVVPSEEDSLTFNLNFSSGEVYKLRASSVKERQQWVDRIRTVIHRHDQALAQNAPHPVTRDQGLPPTPPGSRSHIQNGEPSEALQHLSLTVLDAFGSVHDIVHQSEVKHDDLSRAIEQLPGPADAVPGPHALDEEMLLLKATSQAALYSVEQALSILQDYRELKRGPIVTTMSGKAPKTSFAGLASPLANSPKRSIANLIHVATDLGAGNQQSPSSSSPTKSLRQQTAGGVSSSTASLPVSSSSAIATS